MSTVGATVTLGVTLTLWPSALSRSSLTWVGSSGRMSLILIWAASPTATASGTLSMNAETRVMQKTSALATHIGQCPWDDEQQAGEYQSLANVIMTMNTIWMNR